MGGGGGKAQVVIRKGPLARVTKGPFNEAGTRSRAGMLGPPRWEWGRGGSEADAHEKPCGGATEEDSNAGGSGPPQNALVGAWPYRRVHQGRSVRHDATEGLNGGPAWPLHWDSRFTIHPLP